MALFGAVWLIIAWAQLPSSQGLSDADGRQFRAEIDRQRENLRDAPDKAAAGYELARTWAFGRQWPEAIAQLRTVDGNAGFDPARDPAFAELREAREFQAIASRMRAAAGPVSHSRQAFTVREGDLVPENLAFDPRARRFYFGSMRKGKVLSCSASGDCADFASGLDVILGLKIRGRDLWLLNNSANESALIRYDLVSARRIGRYALNGPHLFNDLVIAPDGGVYLTDTRVNAVWRLPKGGAGLMRLAGRFGHANGIAISPGGKLLFVATYPEGVYVVDLGTGAVRPMPHPANLCMAMIDGLYFHRGALIAIQNGFMTPRVARLALTRDLHAIAGFEVLERGNPLFDGVTTGVIAGDGFYFMANIQDEKKSGFAPISILKLPL